MNRLSIERRAQVVGALVEGMSIRATERMTGVSKPTITKLLVDIGQACSEYQDQAFRNLSMTTIECDEIWAYCYAKQKNVPEEHRDTFGYGDVWTWTAIDSDSKLVPSWLVGERTLEDCWQFLSDLRSRLLVGQRVQLSTDGLGLYQTIVDAIWKDSIDFGIVIKEYGTPPAEDQRRYSPATCQSIEKRVICGDPDASRISTSYVERQNLTMRMGMRRFTRLTNGFSKKVENLAHAVSLHYMHYNFARPHTTLARTHAELGRKVTPAMAAGVARHPWTVFDIVRLLD